MAGKRWMAGGMLSLTLIACLPALAHASGPSFWPLDGLSGTLLAVVLGEDTVYASSYTDAGFRRVQVGMSQHEVHEVLGAPLASWPIESAGGPPEHAEKWSTSPGDTNFRLRVVRFRSGHVVRKIAEFWVD